MAYQRINPDNKIPIIILGISIFVAVTIVIWFFNNPTYLPLVLGSGLYAFLGVISLGFITNTSMQDYFIGIPFSAKTFVWMIGGVFVGLAILSLSYFGLSIGVPLLPNSIGNNLRWIVVSVFSPIFEDILRFSLFGFVLYLTRKCSKSSCSINKKYVLLAVTIQALFFVVIHFSAYATGFYEAPTALGAFTGLSAVSASLIAAFIFAWITGFICSLDGVKTYALSIVAHFVINTVLFVKLTVVGLNILPLILNSIHSLT